MYVTLYVRCIFGRFKMTIETSCLTRLIFDGRKRIKTRNGENTIYGDVKPENERINERQDDAWKNNKTTNDDRAEWNKRHGYSSYFFNAYLVLIYSNHRSSFCATSLNEQRLPSFAFWISARIIAFDTESLCSFIRSMVGLTNY